MAGVEFLFKKSYRITDKICVRHAMLQDIVDLGEERYFQTLQALTAIPSDMKSILDDNGIDYVTLSDFELFGMIIKSLPDEDSNIFLPGIQLSKFRMCKKDDGSLFLFDKENDVILDFYAHKRIVDILCTIHKIKKKPQKPGNAKARELLINLDRKKREENKNKEFKSSLYPIVSAAVNSPGFKYNYSEVQNMLYGQFIDAVARLQIMNITDHLLSGYYNGTIDGTKIDKNKFDPMREI